MRRRRQRLFREPEPIPPTPKSTGQAITAHEVRLWICNQWRPRSTAASITDSKRRAWTVADRTGLDEFGREVPLGSPGVSYRVFWREDHVRAICHLSDADRESSAVALMQQLRRSWRIDHPEASAVTKTERMQSLYDRRGMGKR